MEKWYDSASGDDDIVLGAVATLFRSIDGIPYPVRLNPTQKANINNHICDVAGKTEKDLERLDLKHLYPFEINALAERGLITPEFAVSTEGHTLLLTPDERLSVMLQEEDHLRIRSIEGGLQPEKAYRNALNLEKNLDKDLHFAFEPAFGYLNQNPMHIGTGFHIAVLMHLPSLSGTGKMPGIASMVQKLGLSVRSAIGDSLAVKGDIYRLTNPVTMGLSEEQAIANLKVFALQLATEERRTADEYVKDVNVKDKIQRAYALLTGAALLTTDEMIEMLSWVRLGAVKGLLNVRLPKITELLFTMQPANINCLANRRLPAAERDELRAQLVKKYLTA